MPSWYRGRARRTTPPTPITSASAAFARSTSGCCSANPQFVPAFPAANNPVLREPPRPEGRVWIEDADAIAVVDLANAAYGLMVRLLAYAYVIRGPQAEKSLAVDLAVGLMRAITPLAERAARLPAGPSNPGCNAGMSFIALRDASPLPPGRAARRGISGTAGMFYAGCQ